MATYHNYWCLVGLANQPMSRQVWEDGKPVIEVTISPLGTDQDAIRIDSPDGPPNALRYVFSPPFRNAGNRQEAQTEADLYLREVIRTENHPDRAILTTVARQLIQIRVLVGIDSLP